MSYGIIGGQQLSSGSGSGIHYSTEITLSGSQTNLTGEEDISSFISQLPGKKCSAIIFLTSQITGSGTTLATSTITFIKTLVNESTNSTSYNIPLVWNSSNTTHSIGVTLSVNIELTADTQIFCQLQNSSSVSLVNPKLQLHFYFE